MVIIQVRRSWCKLNDRLSASMVDILELVLFRCSREVVHYMSSCLFTPAVVGPLVPTEPRRHDREAPRSRAANTHGCLCDVGANGN